MRKVLVGYLCFISFSSSALAQTQPRDPSSLLNHLAGNWLLKGQIAGKQTTHDVEAHWIFRHEYLELHEVSREKNAHGEPAYEAMILVSWDPKVNQYACLWLDSTAGGALTSGVACRATPSGDSIPFVFTISPSESIRTTFSYRESLIHGSGSSTMFRAEGQNDLQMLSFRNQSKTRASETGGFRPPFDLRESLLLD